MNTATDIRKPESPAGFTPTHGSDTTCINSITPNVARDRLLESLGPLTTEMVRDVMKWGRECTEARKSDPETYSKCPRCYGYHSYHGTFDNLCMDCCLTIVRDFPNHESVPHIKAAFANVEASEPPTLDVNRDSGTGCANGGSLR